MGQFYPSLYKVTPSIVGSDIRLAAGDHFKVAGQGFTLSSTLSVTTSSLAKNTMYYVYAQYVSTTLSLTYLTSVPSANPTKELVAAFLSSDDTTPVPASLVNIEGIPASDWITFTSALTQIVLNSGTQQCRYKRVGRIAEMNMAIATKALPTPTVLTIAAPGFTFGTPTNLVMDTVTASSTAIGSAYLFQSVTSTFTGTAWGNNTTTFRISGPTGGYWGRDNSSPTTIALGNSFSFIAFPTIVGWTSTQLKDL